MTHTFLISAMGEFSHSDSSTVKIIWQLTALTIIVRYAKYTLYYIPHHSTIERIWGCLEQEMDWANVPEQGINVLQFILILASLKHLATLVRLDLIAQLVQELFFTILLMPKVMSLSSYIKLKYCQTFRAE